MCATQMLYNEQKTNNNHPTTHDIRPPHHHLTDLVRERPRSE
uniref:Uncharacterized protein n=1 Tax=Anopheles dirus TaxID=7168 RepID=A0A182NY67_9DIPT